MYFEDAEKNDLPEMLQPVDWEEVKRYFQAQVKQLAKEWGLV